MTTFWLSPCVVYAVIGKFKLKICAVKIDKLQSNLKLISKFDKYLKYTFSGIKNHCGVVN